MVTRKLSFPRKENLYKIYIFVKRKAIPLFLTILVYHSWGENAFVASQDRVGGLKLRDLNFMCGNYTKTCLVTVSLIRSTLLNLHVSQVQSHSSNCSSRDYLMYNMVGLTHLRQDAVLSAKHLDQIVLMRLFSIRLFSFTKLIPIL